MSHDNRTEMTENTCSQDTVKLDERVRNQAWDDIKSGAFTIKDLKNSPPLALDDQGRICIPDCFPRAPEPRTCEPREPRFTQCTFPVEPIIGEPREPKFIQCTFPVEPVIGEPREPRFIQCTAPVEPIIVPGEPREPSFYLCTAPADPTIFTPEEPGEPITFTPEELEEIRKRVADEAPQPDVTKEELSKAEKKVDQKIEANEANLSPQEKDLRKRLDHAILEGNTKELEKIIREHKDSPEELNRIMNLVASDLREAGVHVVWETGNMMMGDDKDMHPVGYLKVFRDGASKYVSMSTDSRIGTGLGGPITWRDGQAIYNFMAVSGDPDQAMKDIGNSGVRKLNGSGQQARPK